MLNNTSAFTTLDRAAAWSAWTNAFYFTSNGRGYFRDQEGSGNVQYFWQFGADLEVVNSAVSLGLADTNMVNALCMGFTNQNGLDWSWDTYNDDVTGVARAFVGAYQVTGNPEWLTLAKYGFDLGYNRGFDPTNGGISECTSGCADTAETVDGIIVPCYLLAQYLNDPGYLIKAQNLYGFLITNEFVAATGMIEGAPNSGISSTAASDYGFFIQESILLGFTNNALLAAAYATNHFGIVLTGIGGSAGYCLRAMGLTGINTSFAQQACDNAWSWQNSRGLSAAWTYRPSDTNAINTYDAMQLVMGMMSVPPAPPPVLPVTAADTVGSQVIFTTKSFGGTNLVYQWQKISGGVTNNISGATNTALVLTNLQLADAAAYQLSASNVFGVQVSTAGLLAVSNVPSAVSNIVVTDAAQTGLAYGFAFTPSWTPAAGNWLSGQLPGSAVGNFNLVPYYTSRNINSLTAGSSLTLTPEGPDSPDYDNYAVTFMATATLETLAFVGTDLAGGDNTIFIDNVQIFPAAGTPLNIPNAGFETPAVGDFLYNPSGGSWIFNGSSPSGSGIVTNGSAFGNVNAPQGGQAAFIQEHGSISQTISGLTPGITYTLTFVAAQRPGNNQSWNVTANSTVIASYSAGSSVTAGSNYVTCGNGSGAGSNLIYPLPGPASSYNLTNITVYGGWADNARDAQAYTVYYAAAAAPTNFILLKSVSYNPVNTNYNPLYVSYGSVPAVTRTTLSAANGVLASNVVAVEFSFTNPPSENGFCGYAQIGVFGTPNGITINTTNQTGSMGVFPFTPGWGVVTNGDLILRQLPAAATGNFTEEISGRNVNSLTDGGSLTINSITGNNGTTTSTNYVTCGNGGGAGATVIYALTGATNGYSLTNITVYGGWQDNGRDAQAYTVYYATVSALTNYLLLTSVSNNPSVPAGTPSATRVTLAATDGVLATNVAAVKFDFTNPASENGYCGYAEIAVFGFPTVIPPSMNPTNLGFQMAANNLTLNWPGDHTGWRLQVQTNDLTQGLSTNWVDVAGSTLTNQMTLPVNFTAGSFFYRLIYP